MNNGKKAGGTKRMAGLAIFTALIVVLTVLCTFVKFGPVSITLALAPIVIGAALYGAGAGAYLGFVFSLVVLLTGLFGWDGGFILMLFDMKWYGLILTVLVKGTAAGYAAGLVYRLLCRKSEKAAVLVAGIVCPVVNTGLFFAGMALFFMDTLSGMAANAGQSVIVYMVLGLAGINFVVELLVNIALSSGITHIIKSRKRGRA